MARQPSKDKIQARGIGLKASEWQELEKIAADIGITAHAAAAWAIRHFMNEYKAGRIKTQSKKVQALPDP
jgi:hypothetical protein